MLVHLITVWTKFKGKGRRSQFTVTGSRTIFLKSVGATFLWPPNRQAIILCSYGFCLLLSSFSFLAYSQRSQIECLPHFSHHVAFSENLGCRSERTQKFTICAPSHNFIGIFSQLRHISTVRKIFLNISLLTAEIGWPVWDTPANFNGFRVLASLLHQSRSTEVNQTLHDVWPSPELVHYV